MTKVKKKNMESKWGRDCRGSGGFGLDVFEWARENPEELPPEAEVKLLERSLEWAHALGGMLRSLRDLSGANLADRR